MVMVRVYILVISYHLSMIVRLKDDCMKASHSYKSSSCYNTSFPHHAIDLGARLP